MKSISEKQILDRLAEENPWWSEADADHPFFPMRPRAYLDLFFPLVKAEQPRRAVVLLGPRRVGKTVMIHQAIGQLLDAGIAGRNICYINLEVPTYNGLGLEDFLRLFARASGANSGERLFVFFDEIQYLRQWEVQLKTIVDSHRNMKCVASGSAAAALRLRSNESGAGRFTDFLLPPVLFSEYVDLKGLHDLVYLEENKTHDGENRFATRDIQELNSHFVDYLNFGGYPEVIFSPEIQANPGRFIRRDIIDKVLLRDLPSLYGIHDIQELNSLFTTLAYNTANEVSLEKLSENSGVGKNTIKRYIEYLESAFLIKTISRVDQSARKFRRRNFFKVFLTNPSMRSALFSPLAATDDDIGHLVETGVFAQWFDAAYQEIFYARWKHGEVDIVNLLNDAAPLWAVEVKWSDAHAQSPRELKSLCRFLREHPQCAALATTRTVSGRLTLENVDIELQPASLYCYNLGRNGIDGQKILNRKLL